MILGDICYDFYVLNKNGCSVVPRRRLYRCDDIGLSLVLPAMYDLSMTTDQGAAWTRIVYIGYMPSLLSLEATAVLLRLFRLLGLWFHTLLID